MVKGIALMKRKPSLSTWEFRKHYEEVHAPLAMKLFPTLKKYVRNYVNNSIGAPSSIEEPEFDCITEQWFEDMEGFQAMMDISASEDGRAIRDDEKTLFDRRRSLYLLVEEKASG